MRREEVEVDGHLYEVRESSIRQFRAILAEQKPSEGDAEPDATLGSSLIERLAMQCVYPSSAAGKTGPKAKAIGESLLDFASSDYRAIIASVSRVHGLERAAAIIEAAPDGSGEDDDEEDPRLDEGNVAA